MDHPTAPERTKRGGGRDDSNPGGSLRLPQPTLAQLAAYPAEAGHGANTIAYCGPPPPPPTRATLSDKRLICGGDNKSPIVAPLWKSRSNKIICRRPVDAALRRVAETKAPFDGEEETIGAGTQGAAGGNERPEPPFHLPSSPGVPLPEIAIASIGLGKVCSVVRPSVRHAFRSTLWPLAGCARVAQDGFSLVLGLARRRERRPVVN